MSAAIGGPSSAAPALEREPGWVKHAIWWQVYPLGFVGARTDAAPTPSSLPANSPAPGTVAAPGSALAAPVDHRLGRIAEWIDYALELGASGLALGPVFTSESHGYDTVDFFSVDPRLGDDSDFDALVGAARAKGLRITLDGVFNHVGRSFLPFQRALTGGVDAPESAWFRRVGGATSHVGVGPSGQTPDAAAPSGQTPDAAAEAARYENFEGHDALIALNHDEPAVADFVVDVMKHWLGRGIDGWRLDAAYAVPPAFWATVLTRVREDFPEAFFFGEVIHGDYSGLVDDARFDSLTQYESWKAIENSLAERNFFELDHALARHSGYLETFAPVTFVGNHDVTRLATIIEDERHRAHALVVLMTIGGTPTIYYGDERGYKGVKEERVGGDDAIRPEFPAGGPSAFGGPGSGGPGSGGPGSGGAGSGGPGSGGAAEETFRLHQLLIGVRRRHPWLHRATTTPVTLTNTLYAYESRDGAAGILTILNLEDSTQSVTLDHPRSLTVIAGSAALQPGASEATAVEIPAHGWAILEATVTTG